MKSLWSALIRIFNSKPLSISEKDNIKKCLNYSWEEYKKRSKEEIQKETIDLAHNYGFKNNSYSECEIFLKNMYKSY